MGGRLRGEDEAVDHVPRQLLSVGFEVWAAPDGAEEEGEAEQHIEDDAGHDDQRLLQRRPVLEQVLVLVPDDVACQTTRPESRRRFGVRLSGRGSDATDRKAESGKADGNDFNNLPSESIS